MDMKKIVYLSLLALCLPWTLVAQSADDDLYYIPSKKKENAKVEKKEPTAPARVVIETKAPTTVYTVPESTATTTVVVKDRKGNKRSVDEYNRRYTARENDFSVENDTLYIEEKAQPDLEGEWVNGEFQGSEDDYEYATRIIRFRNPRYAISISSPLYWDVVYGLNSWDWNVYTDGLYAYAFPTYTNRLWWDWRYNYYGWGWPSYYGWGWNSWYAPYWGFSWGGWYGGYYAGWWGHHHHHYYHDHWGWYSPGGYWGGNAHWGNAYTTRRSVGSSLGSYAGTRSSGTTARRSSVINGGQSVRRTATSTGQVRRGTSAAGNATRRVVGTRSTVTNSRSEASGVRSGANSNRATSIVRSSATRSSATRSDAASTRRSTYTRPSSTRSSVSGTRSAGSVNRSSAVTPSRSRSTTPTYSRGSSTSPTRTYSGSNTRSSSSYSAPSRSSVNTRSSSSFSSGSSSSRSSFSGSAGGGATRSSGGGGSHRR